MSEFLGDGIAAVKKGHKSEAFRLLSRATQDSTTAVQAWIWLSGVVESDAERLFCLENALRTEPGHSGRSSSESLTF